MGDMYGNRVYRRLHKGKNLTYFTASVEQTNLHIGARCLLREKAVERVCFYRRQIEEYIREDEVFLTSLVPWLAKPEAPGIVRWMCEAAEKAGVGPMAAVAGAISERVGRDLLPLSREIIIENGGDIFLKTDRERVIGIFAGESPLNEKIGLRISPEDSPVGICTSSGKMGHSLSFGKADAVVILARDTALADAMATATGNRVKGKEDIQDAIGFAREIRGVLGVLIIVEDALGAWGEIDLVKL